MKTIGYIILGISILFTLAWSFNIRQKAKNEQSTEKGMELQGFLMTISIILILVIPLSPFHLLWMLPTSFIVGLLSITTPLNILWIFSSFYFSFWYIGISNPGRKFYVNGEYEKAVAEFMKEVNRNPSSAESYFNLALAYGKIGQHENEIASYQKAVELMPNKPELHFNLGIAFSDIGDEQKSIESLIKAINLKPDYIKAHYFIGRSYAKIGEIGKADNQVEILRKLDNDTANKLAEIIISK
jgi:tetratricopeptide (TPR) repeat protein